MSEVFIEISKDEDVKLPKEYYKIHNLCAIIYGQLSEIYKDELYKELFVTGFSFKDEQEFNSLNSIKEQGTHILDWLNNTGKQNELEIVLSKHLLTALVFDMLNFIFESLFCAKRGKMTVAYALLRKPFTDELLILEQLLVDRKGFINKFFHSGVPEEYDPSNRNINKLDIISKAIKALNNPLFKADFINEVRYDKSCNYGINGRSNHALHIVTRDKNYKTENQNFNFIFSTENDLEIYYRHYYTIIPNLLIYATAIIDKLTFSFIENTQSVNRKILKDFRRTLAMVFSLEYTAKGERKDTPFFDMIKELLTLECPNCNYSASIERADCELFLQTELFLCPKCLNNILDDDSIKIIGKLFVKS